jgi:hypothetical protein
MPAPESQSLTGTLMSVPSASWKKFTALIIHAVLIVVMSLAGTLTPHAAAGALMPALVGIGVMGLTLLVYVITQGRIDLAKITPPPTTPLGEILAAAEAAAEKRAHAVIENALNRMPSILPQAITGTQEPVPAEVAGTSAV